MKKKKKVFFSVLFIYFLLFSLMSCSCNLNETNHNEKQFQTLEKQGINAYQENKLDEAKSYLEAALKIRSDAETESLLKDCYDQENNKQKELSFQVLKEKGITANNNDKTYDGIRLLEKALSIKEDNEIKVILSKAYIDFGEYCHTAEHYPLAEWVMFESMKLDSNSKAPAFFKKVCNVTEEIQLLSPPNQSKVENYSGVLDFSWKPVLYAQSYTIQIEDENRKLFHEATSKDTRCLIYKQPKFQSNRVYYWRVRANFPVSITGKWSKMNWFSVYSRQAWQGQ